VTGVQTCALPIWHIHLIAHQAKADIAKMYTNLMGTAGFQTGLDTSEMLETLFDVVMRYGIFTTRKHSHFHTIHRMALDRLINCTASNNIAVNHQIIQTIHGFLLKLFA